MNELKDYKIIMLILICLAVATIGGSFAYFYAVVTGTGNTTNNSTDVTAVTLGTVNYDGETTFDSTGIYPGYYGIQTFTVSPGSDGIGTYEIDLASTLPTEFETDVEITLYKTTDPTNNYLTKVSGTLTKDGDNFYQEDTLTTTGKLDVAYITQTITNSAKKILEVQDFTIPGFSTTTYYLVYHYKNNGNQNTQEGKIFNGKVTVNMSTKDSLTATLITGTSFYKLKKNTSATSFAHTDVAPDLSTMTSTNIISDSSLSDVPVYMWYDSATTTVKWWSSAKTVYMNPNSGTMFADTPFSSIDLTGLDSSKIIDMNAFFASNQKLVNIIALEQMNTSNVTIMSNVFNKVSFYLKCNK